MGLFHVNLMKRHNNKESNHTYLLGNFYVATNIFCATIVQQYNNNKPFLVAKDILIKIK